jgi:hypothetical protein
MIELISLNGSEIQVALGPEARARKKGEDLSLRKLVGAELAASDKEFWMATENYIYLEDDQCLNLGALILSEVDSSLDWQEIIGSDADFYVGFDSEVFLLCTSITSSGPQIISETLLSHDDAVEKLSSSDSHTLLIGAGLLTDSLAENGCGDSGIEIDFLSPPKAFLFQRGLTSARLVKTGLAVSFGVLAVYLLVSFVVWALPEPEEIVPDRSPRATADAAAVLLNVAETQSQYLPLFSHGLSSLKSQVAGASLSMVAGGVADGMPLIQRDRMNALARMVGGKLDVFRSGWLIDGIPDPRAGVSVAPLPLTPFQPQIEAVLRLHRGDVRVVAGKTFDRGSGAAGLFSDRYKEIRVVLMVAAPSERKIKAVSKFLQENAIQAQYLSHSYLIKEGRFDGMSIEILIRGDVNETF